MSIDPLVGKQKASIELATAHLNIWEGSVRSSKTVCSLIAWLIYVRTGPAGNLAMIGKTERTLKRNVIDPLIDMLGPKRCKYNAGNGELTLLGRRIYVAGANNEAAVSKIQGLTLAGAYVDEAALMPESMWAMLLTRLSIEGAQLFATTNPDNPNHWLMRDFLRRAATWLRHDGTVVQSDAPDRLDLCRMSFRLADNPSLPAGYVANLAKQFTGLWRLRFIEGLWVLAEGAIYDTFDPTPVDDPADGHVVTAIPGIREWVVAVDYGTVNPFVALLIGLGVDDRIYVASEYRHDSRAAHRQMTDAEYSAAMRKWLDEFGEARGRPIVLQRVIVDPSASSFIAQLYKDGWDHVRKADNKVADGIRTTSSLLVADRWKIHESCTAGIAEKTGYVWNPKSAEKGVEEPLKQDDHFPDAERYGVMGTRMWWRFWLSEPVRQLVDDDLADVA